MAAANFCLGKEDDKIRWACYRELLENRTVIPQAALIKSKHLFIYNVYTYNACVDITLITPTAYDLTATIL